MAGLQAVGLKQKPKHERLNADQIGLTEHKHESCSIARKVATEEREPCTSNYPEPKMLSRQYNTSARRGDFVYVSEKRR
jgi:hypothetical protein